MNRRFSLLLLAAALAIAAPAHAQQTTLLNFTDFDYEDPGDGPPYLGVGDGYNSVGFITSVGPMLQPYVDFDNNEYTYYLFGLTVATSQFDGDNLFCTFNNNARVRYFEDPNARPKTPGTYGVNPPNATSPSSFSDPLPPALGGDLDNFTYFYTFSAGTGGWSGAMTLDEGTKLIYIPAGERAGWLLGATAGPPNPSIPTGYDHQVEGNCIIPVTAVEHPTWGTIKNLYR
jgi:hypothetical protein